MNETVENIRRIRASNNDLWMAILKEALNSSPVSTKRILRQIRLNDIEISRLTGELSGEDSE